MTKPALTLTGLPFSGFYESLWSSGIDREEEQWCEWRATENNDSPDDEARHPEELRLDAGELAELLFRATDYSKAYLQIAGDYVSAFDYAAGELLGFTAKATRKRYDVQTRQFVTEEYRRPSIRLTFESMDSPREYNFTTDRLFAHIPAVIVRVLFKRSAAEKHATLAATIADRFTSYDGFLSHYSNKLDSWLAKPIANWDHNEVETLLIASLKMAGADMRDFGNELYESVADGEGFYQAWESAVDWPKFEALRDEARADKAAELDPEIAAELAARTPRCSETPDMFTGQADRA